MNFAMLACSSLIGVAIDRYGMKPPLAIGPMLVGCALGLVSYAGSFDALTPAVVLLGIAGGALNAAANTLTADLHDDPRRKSAALNLLGVFFGFGALVLPFSIGALLATFGIDALLLAAAGLCVAMGVVAALLRFPEPKQPQRLPIAEMPRFIRSGLVAAMASLLFFQSGVEFTLGGYISTYLTRGMNVAVASASWVLAGYWAAVMLARVIMSRVLLGANPHRVVFWSAAVACAGAAAVFISANVTAAAAAIIVTGFAMAAIYPTVLGIAGTRFREHSGTVFGLLFTVALAGGMILPWTAGRLADTLGVASVFQLVSLAFAAIVVLSLMVARRSRPSPDSLKVQ
jgi:fucose permease